MPREIVDDVKDRTQWQSVEPAEECNVSPFQIQILSGAMIAVAALVAVGWSILTIVYRRIGYPAMPEWYHSIRLSDGIETVFDKIQVAVDGGFTIVQHDDQKLIIERAFSRPACTMRFEAVRTGMSWQKLSVRCPQHRWLNWSTSVGRTRR